MPGTITTAFPNSFKNELPQAKHNFTASTGHDFKAALIKPSPTGSYGAASVNYSDVTGNSDEVTGTGYSAGGFDFTAADNITPALDGSTSVWSWSVNPSWTTATISAAGVIIYNASASNKAVYVGSLGGTQTVTVGTLTLQLPTNAATTAILRLA